MSPRRERMNLIRRLATKSLGFSRRAAMGSLAEQLEAL
jgi:hypothetical protein